MNSISSAELPLSSSILLPLLRITFLKLSTNWKISLEDKETIEVDPETEEAKTETDLKEDKIIEEETTIDPQEITEEMTEAMTEETTEEMIEEITKEE